MYLDLTKHTYPCTCTIVSLLGLDFLSYITFLSRILAIRNEMGKLYMIWIVFLSLCRWYTIILIPKRKDYTGNKGSLTFNIYFIDAMIPLVSAAFPLTIGGSYENFAKPASFYCVWKVSQGHLILKCYMGGRAIS